MVPTTAIRARRRVFCSCPCYSAGRDRKSEGWRIGEGERELEEGRGAPDMGDSEGMEKELVQQPGFFDQKGHCPRVLVHATLCTLAGLSSRGRAAG